MTVMYASLVGPLLGLYYPLPFNQDFPTKNRVALNTSKLKDLWCSVYPEPEVDRQIAQWGGVKLEMSQLDYDSHAVNQTEG